MKEMSLTDKILREAKFSDEIFKKFTFGDAKYEEPD